MITNVEITLLEATDYAAKLQLKAIGPSGSISGSIRGPRCAGQSTLPATFALRPTSEPNSAECEILEPCYWRAEQPFVYDVLVTLHADGEHAWRGQFALNGR